MGSDENKKPKAEWFPGNSDKAIRLLAYTYSISGKAGDIEPSKNSKVEGGTGIAGLMKELEKTKLDV